MQNPAVDPALEDELFAKEVEEVKKWWSDPRWRYTKRPFTAEQIVNKRGNLKIEYASNQQAKKLWKILEKRFAVGLCGRNLAHSAFLLTTEVSRSVMLATPTAALSPLL
jgi:Isocitrate lyase